MMTRLSQRKTKLQFTTDAEVRYRGKLRAVVVEVQDGFTASVRLAGTRQRYEFSWHGLHDWAAELHARRERERRKAERIARKKVA
jgi:citrate lyase beta subunit